MENLTSDTVAHHFNRLATLLAYRMLPTEGGGKRLAGTDEFMLMQVRDGVAHFKHRDSRNYVHLKVDHEGDGYLKVPDDGTPFHRGTFDVFDDAAIEAAERAINERAILSSRGEI